MLFLTPTIITSRAFAPLSARHTQLEALTVALEATGLLACAALSMLEALATDAFGYFGGEGFGVSFHYFFLGEKDFFLMRVLVIAILAPTFNATDLTIGKALTVQLQAARF